jgi:hypothetical protein
VFKLKLAQLADIFCVWVRQGFSRPKCFQPLVCLWLEWRWIAGQGRFEPMCQVTMRLWESFFVLQFNDKAANNGLLLFVFLLNNKHIKIHRGHQIQEQRQNQHHRNQ